MGRLIFSENSVRWPDESATPIRTAGRAWALIRAACAGPVHWLDGFRIFPTWRIGTQKSDYLRQFRPLATGANEILARLVGTDQVLLDHPVESSTDEWVLAGEASQQLSSNIADTVGLASKTCTCFRRGRQKEGWHRLAEACQCLLPEAATALSRPLALASTDRHAIRLPEHIKDLLERHRRVLAQALAKAVLLAAGRHQGLDYDAHQGVFARWIQNLVTCNMALAALANATPSDSLLLVAPTDEFISLASDYCDGLDPASEGPDTSQDELLQRLSCLELAISARDQVISDIEQLRDRQVPAVTLDEARWPYFLHYFLEAWNANGRPAKGLYGMLCHDMRQFLESDADVSRLGGICTAEHLDLAQKANRLLRLIGSLTEVDNTTLETVLRNTVGLSAMPSTAMITSIGKGQTGPQAAEEAPDHEQRLKSYCREVRGKYETLRPIAGQGRPLPQDLYLDRQLIETRDDALKGHARGSGEFPEPRPEPRTHSEAELLRRLCSPSTTRVCITGEAGIGKSTLLVRLAWHLAGADLDTSAKRSRPVPVPVDLSAWTDYVADQTDRHQRTLVNLAHYCNHRLDEALLRELCRDGQAVFLLDGLDEAGGGREVESVAVWLDDELHAEPLKRCSVVLASRPWAWRGQYRLRTRLEEWAVKALKPSEIEDYIKNHFPKDSPQPDRLRRHLEQHPALSRLVSRPLLLALLCFVAEDGQTELPQSEGELLGEALDEMIRRRQEAIAVHLRLRQPRVGVEACLVVLEHLAWASWRAPEGRLTRKKALRAILEALRGDDLVAAEFEGHTPDELWECLVRHTGLLTEQGREDCHFAAEESYREFLVGSCLAQRDETFIVETFGRHVWDPAWTRVLRFMTGRLWQERPTLAERLIRWLVAEHETGRDDRWGYLLREAGWLLSLAPAKEQKRLAQLEQHLVGLLDSVFRRAVGDSVEVDLPPVLGQVLLLIAALRDENENHLVRMAAAEALGQLGDPRAVEPLIAALREENEEPWVRSRAALVLGRLGDPRVVGLLIAALREENEDSGVRTQAAIVLGWLGDPRAVKPLIAALRGTSEGPWWVRSEAAEALGELGKASAVQPLMAALRDQNEDSRVRTDAAAALGELGEASAVQPLMAALRDENEDSGVRTEAAAALGKLGNAGAVKPLIAALQDDNGGLWVRRAAAEALGELGNAGAVKPLIAALRGADEEPRVRSAAAEALGELGNAGAVKPLIAALQDENEKPAVRSAAAEALGKLGDPRAVKPLIAALQDENGGPWVRSAAAEALGELGDAGAVKPLIAALAAAREHPWVREAGTKALGELGDPEGLQAVAERHEWSVLAGLKSFAVLRGPRVVARATHQLDPELLPSS